MSYIRIHRIAKATIAIPSIGSGEWKISSFMMTMTLNSLPTARLLVDGTYLDKKGRKAANQSILVEAFDLANTASSLNGLLKHAAKKTVCTVTLQVEYFNGSGVGGTSAKELVLKDWLIVSAGLGTVSTTEGFQYGIEIAHPIYELASHGGFLNLAKASEYDLSLIDSVSDPLDAGIKMYDRILSMDHYQPKYSSTSIQPAGKDPSSIIEDVNSVFKAVPDLLKKYIYWGGSGGIPYKSVISGTNIEKAIKKTMMQLWSPVSDSAVWDIMIRNVCGSLNLVVFYDPASKDNQLCMKPMYPWVEPAFGINQEACYEITFPASDPAPIYGLCSAPQMIMASKLLISSYKAEKAHDMDDKATYTAFVPDTGSNISGNFITCSYPEWLITAIRTAASFTTKAQKVKPTSYAGAGNKPKGQVAGSGECTEYVKANDLQMQSLACDFLKMYKKRLESQIICPFLGMQTPDGEWIKPGEGVKVTAGGKELYRGYIISVSHNLNMKTGYGATSFHLAYCSPEGSYPAVQSVLGEDKNPMYASGQ